MTAGTFPPDAVAAAVASRRKWGIPASVTLAQWAVESAWGARMSGRNNPFGIKGRPPAPCTACMTREELHDGTMVHVTQYFADYPTVEGAFDAHGRLLATGAPYAHARSLLPDAEAFADALTGVYATDHRYGQTLIGIMRAHDLADCDAVSSAIAVPKAAASTVPPPPIGPHNPVPQLSRWQHLMAAVGLLKRAA